MSCLNRLRKILPTASATALVVIFPTAEILRAHNACAWCRNLSILSPIQIPIHRCATGCTWRCTRLRMRALPAIPRHGGIGAATTDQKNWQNSNGWSGGRFAGTNKAGASQAAAEKTATALAREFFRSGKDD